MFANIAPIKAWGGLTHKWRKVKAQGGKRENREDCWKKSARPRFNHRGPWYGESQRRRERKKGISVLRTPKPHGGRVLRTKGLNNRKRDVIYEGSKIISSSRHFTPKGGGRTNYKLGGVIESKGGGETEPQIRSSCDLNRPFSCNNNVAGKKAVIAPISTTSARGCWIWGSLGSGEKTGGGEVKDK